MQERDRRARCLAADILAKKKCSSPFCAKLVCPIFPSVKLQNGFMDQKMSPKLTTIGVRSKWVTFQNLSSFEFL